MLVRCILLLLLHIIFVGLLHTQTTFNKRINFGFPAQLLTSVETDSSGIYCLGVIGDSIFPYQDGSILVKFNHEGDQEWFKLMTSVEKPISTYYSNMRWNNNNLKYGGYYKENGNYLGLLFEIDKYGELIDTSTINPLTNYPTNLMYVQNWYELPEGEIIITPFNYNKKGRLGIVKRINGEVVKEVVINHTYNIGNNSLLEYSKNKILIGNSVTSTIIGDDIFRCNIIAIDTSLIIASAIWESHPDSFWVNPVDMIKDPDGGVIVAFQRGKYILAAQEILYVPAIFKLNTDFSTIDWITDIPTFDYSSLNSSHKLLHDTLENVFYICGEDVRPDTLLNGSTMLGYLAKFSVDGIMYWLRRYSVFTARYDRHYLYDMKRTSDNGFVFVGEATDFTNESESPRQQAWLLKVDSFGCLVPGCQMVSPVTDVTATLLDVRLYPNPVRDGQTAIYIGEQQSLGNAAVTFLDLHGHILKSWPIEHRDPTTYILELPTVPSGMYMLHVQAGQRVWTEKVIVE